jgi:tetratricopeptide (TPR) repeat protein
VIAIAREPVSPSAEPALDGLMLALPSQPGAMRLRDALALGEGFELHLVACATPRVARALLAWLSVEAGRSDRGAKFERIAVQLGPDGAVVDGPELAGALLGVLTTPPGASVVRFLDASAVRTVDLPAWEWFVQRLNERRNQVAAAAPAPLVLLLGPALARSLPFLAPDLWSVRSVDVALGEAPAMPGVEGVEVALAPWVLAGDEPSAVRAELEDLGDPEGPHAARARLSLLGRLARALRQRGELAAAERVINDEWIPSAEALGDEGEVAEARVELASILVTRGEWDAAQRLLGQARATFERLGDVRSRAVTLGKIADILADRGDLDEALRIRREEELPVYERLGDVRSRAITLGQVADILAARGDLDEALHIWRKEELPVYARLGDVRARALTLGKVADILAARGDLDEALRTLREDLLPVFERLGDIRARAVTLGKVADILAARGDLDEALRIRREEELPVYERLGGRDLMVGLANLGILLVQRGRPADLVEARSCLERARALADAMKLPFPDELRAWLASGARSA